MYKSASKNRTRHQDFDLYDDLQKIKDALSQTTVDVRGRANEMISQSFENAKDRAVNLQDNTANYISERPFKALGIALLVGIVAGYWFHK